MFWTLIIVLRSDNVLKWLLFCQCILWLNCSEPLLLKHLPFLMLLLKSCPAARTIDVELQRDSKSRRIAYRQQEHSPSSAIHKGAGSLVTGCSQTHPFPLPPPPPPPPTPFLPAAPIHSQWALFCSTGIIPVEVMEQLRPAALWMARKVPSFTAWGIFLGSTGIVPGKAGNGCTDGFMNRAVTKLFPTSFSYQAQTQTDISTWILVPWKLGHVHYIKRDCSLGKMLHI